MNIFSGRNWTSVYWFPNDTFSSDWSYGCILYAEMTVTRTRNLPVVAEGSSQPG